MVIKFDLAEKALLFEEALKESKSSTVSFNVNVCKVKGYLA